MEDEGEKPEEALAPGQPPLATTQPALDGWRAPAFWMACGALLAGLAVGAVMLLQRVDAERDMAAVAVMLPPPEPQPAAPMPEAPPAAPSPAEVPAVAAPAAPPPMVSSGAIATTATPKEAAPRRRTGERRVQAPTARKPAAAAAKHTAKQSRKVAAKLKTKRGAKRKAVPEQPIYWEVFKRCPLPGEPGAVECRLHVCNGAEGEGPACKPYRGRWR